MNEQQEYAKKVKKMAQDASELLTSYKYDEGKEVIKELSTLLKQAEDMKLPKSLTDSLRTQIRGFFAADSEIFNLKRRSVAIGHSLADYANEM